VIENYLDLEKLRYSHTLDLVFEYKIDDLQTMIAPLLLLPFVENAFKHGVSETRKKPIIHIHLEVSVNQLFFTVKNSYTPEPKHSTKGIGLSNIRRQLELLYGDKAQLQQVISGDFYEIELMIQLRTYAEN
ncbi:MAG: GHKL domain-containing protein, partial [Bacteroidota bacterium]